MEEILISSDFPSEEKGACNVTPDMHAFSDWIRFQNLVDPLMGVAKYTWSNGQESPVLSRLDRF